MIEHYPEPDESLEADEGNRAHDLAAKVVARFLGLSAETIAYPDDKDMVDGANLYAANIVDAVGTPLDTDLFLIEHGIAAPAVHDQSYGTLDFGFIRGTKATIWDYKYGFATVEAMENWQGLNYAAGLKQAYPYLTHFEFRIVQPRSPHAGGAIRKWAFPEIQLDRAVSILAGAATYALDPSMGYPLHAGRHCRHCSAAHGCQELANATALYVDAAHGASKFDLDEQSLARELAMLTDAAEMVKFRKTSLEAQAEAHLKAGKLLPGWHLQPKAGRLHWEVSDDAVIEFGRLANVKLHKFAVITPTQAKKEGVPDTVINQLAKRSAGSLKLERDNLKVIKQKLEGK